MSDFRDPNFDRLLGQLTGLPDIVHTGLSTIRAAAPLGIGTTNTTVVQTFRHRELGDFTFVEHVSEAGVFRAVLGPEVTGCIQRHRDQLTDKSRSRAAQRSAEDRRERGIQPAFLKGKRK